MRIIVALAVGAFFGFAAMAMVGVESRQEACKRSYDEGFRDGIEIGEKTVRDEYEFLAKMTAARRYADNEEERGGEACTS